MNIYNYYICIYTTIFFLNICIETIYSCKTMMMMITSAKEKRETERRREKQEQVTNSSRKTTSLIIMKHKLKTDY